MKKQRPDGRRFLLVLHSHIPYVLSHGTWPHGADWLHEAAAETYLPLLNVLRRLAAEGISPRVSIGFTPVLAEQLKSAAFQDGFRGYLKMKAAAADQDQRHFFRTGERALEGLARHWKEHYDRLLSFFEESFRSDLIDAYRRLQDEGHVEILTSAATHAYFPLLSEDESIRAQIRQGKLTYVRHFGREPRGFWLPECAYRPGYSWAPPLGRGRSRARPGVDQLLKEEGLGCTFVDAHLLRGGTPRGVYQELYPGLKKIWEAGRKQGRSRRRTARDPYRPHRVHPSGLPVYFRDEATGRQVWSRDMGYPGDGWYLEFHKKRFPGGLRYWRITSSRADLADKAVYDPEKVAERLDENAAHFVGLLEKTLARRAQAVVVSMYDTELFGHWWFEGPEWIYHVLKRLAGSSIRPATASECLAQVPPPPHLLGLPEGSWGEGGFHSVWLNEATSWIWEKIYAVEASWKRLKLRVAASDRRLVKQFIREKFLLESSDWPFLISTWSARDYAENRAAEHAVRAVRLADWLSRGGPLSPEEERLLCSWEQADGLFPEVPGPGGGAVE
jgi:1,4-alpha-glucan branching enzyme